MEEKKTLTVLEVSKLLGISLPLTYRKLRSGEIPSIRLGDRWLVSRVQLDRFLSGECSQIQTANK